ncbi:CGNR zinc finger domain-containing protein [Pseudomonas sp. LP_7_YM]|uniref:CGNR zinc finger domain-containing protein n=1 Tax=Pseudomonas sp. LP_7_YM TaxID=2485137 RepID=UPI0010EBD97B|nr:CGNR zinc finger domain-containing protein [Pseudomonas sp. LP_7_YM]TDV63423.1 putative stress-induced transcription regulator [Pseudomonas sp. LP_7_YM]
MSMGQLKINAIRLVGGVSVLDYLNTCDGRRPGTSLAEVVDKLSSLEDIVHWFLHVGLIEPDEHERLVQLVHDSSWHTVPVFKQLVAFREALYGLFLPIALGGAVNQARLEELNHVLAVTSAQRVLVSTPLGVIWRWRPCHTLEEMTSGFLGRMAVQAAALLTSPDLVRLKACATPDCDWLFVDTSKNGRRRWCQMNVCGAKEKARRAIG